MLSNCEETLKEVIGCFEAAIFEGLYTALENTEDSRLKDLIERRVLWAYYAAVDQLKEK